MSAAPEAFDLGAYQRERIARLERSVKFSDAERERLERLLALALSVCVGQTGCSELALLDVLEAMDAQAAAA